MKLLNFVLPFSVLVAVSSVNLSAKKYDDEYVQEIKQDGSVQQAIDVKKGSTHKATSKTPSKKVAQRPQPTEQKIVKRAPITYTPEVEEERPATRQVVRRRVVRERSDGSSTGKGILGGAAAGAMVGGLAGGGKGAGIGLGVGALTGGLIGSARDRDRAREVVYEEEYLD